MCSTGQSKLQAEGTHMASLAYSLLMSRHGREGQGEASTAAPNKAIRNVKECGGAACMLPAGQRSPWSLERVTTHIEFNSSSHRQVGCN